MQGYVKLGLAVVRYNGTKIVNRKVYNRPHNGLEKANSVPV